MIVILEVVWCNHEGSERFDCTVCHSARFMCRLFSPRSWESVLASSYNKEPLHHLVCSQFRTAKLEVICVHSSQVIHVRTKMASLFLSLSPPQARLTCPCCNSRVKDAVLTKCFHVFCFECVKTRYDTRQRKCPKCNAAFGANDFHRIYIGWRRRVYWRGKKGANKRSSSTNTAGGKTHHYEHVPALPPPYKTTRVWYLWMIPAS